MQDHELNIDHHLSGLTLSTEQRGDRGTDWSRPLQRKIETDIRIEKDKERFSPYSKKGPPRSLKSGFEILPHPIFGLVQTLAEVF